MPIALGLVLRERASWRPQLVLRLENKFVVSSIITSPHLSRVALVAGRRTTDMQRMQIVTLDARSHKVLWSRTDFGFPIAAFIPQKPLLATWDGETLRLRKTGTGELIKSFDQLHATSFSPDGKTMICADGQQHSHVSNTSRLSAGKVQFESCIGDRFKDIFGAQSWSPDGRLVALANLSITNERVELWNTRTWTLQSTLKHSEKVKSLAFSPNGSYLAAAQENGFVVWVVSTKRKLWLRHGFSEGSIAFSPDSRLLAVMHHETIRLWRIKHGEVQRALHSPRGQFTAFAFAPDGNSLLTGNDNGEVHRWRLR